MTSQEEERRARERLRQLERGRKTAARNRAQQRSQREREERRAAKRRVRELQRSEERLDRRVSVLRARLDGYADRPRISAAEEKAAAEYERKSAELRGVIATRRRLERESD